MWQPQTSWQDEVLKLTTANAKDSTIWLVKKKSHGEENIDECASIFNFMYLL